MEQIGLHFEVAQGPKSLDFWTTLLSMDGE